MSLLKEISENEAGILMYSAIFTKDRTVTNARKMGNLVFYPNTEGKFIPVDFLPTIGLANIMSVPSIRQGLGITWGMRPHHAEFFRNYIKQKPITPYNCEWYEKMRAHVTGNNGFQLDIPELTNLINRSYFEHSQKKLSNVSNPRDYFPTVLGSSTTYSTNNCDLKLILSSNRGAGINRYSEAGAGSNIWIGKSMLLCDSYIGERDSFDTRKIGWCFMLKSEYYQDWYEAVFENQTMMDSCVAELATWKSTLSKRICMNRNSGVWKTKVNPEWFVLMVDVFALQAVQVINLDFANIVDGLQELIDEAKAEGIPISYVTNYSLSTFSSQLEANFVKNLGSNMLEHEKKGKELLASISRTLKRASV